MATKDLPPIAVIRQLVAFDAATGLLTWKTRGPQWFKAKGKGSGPARWNAIYANTPAFATRGSDGYLYGEVFGIKVSAHRVLWALRTGDWPKGEIDHINGIKDDNRVENLRDVTHAENGRNLALSPRATSGVSGVHWNKARQKWQASIRPGGQRIHIGLFPDFDAAVAARKAAEIAHGFHPNHGRAAP